MPPIGELVAKEQIRLASMGKRGSVTSLAKQFGASPSYADNGFIQQSKPYKAVMSKEAVKLNTGFNKAIDALNRKKFGKEKVVTLVQAVDVLNKNRRLEIGKDDERTQPIVNIINYNTQVNIDTVKPNGKSTL